MSIAKQAIEKYQGKIIPYTCTTEVIVGDVVPLGVSLVGIAVSSGLPGEVISLEIEKVWTITAATVDAIAIGDTLYWNATAKELTTTSTDNVYAGRSVSSKSANTAGTIDIKINI